MFLARSDLFNSEDRINFSRGEILNSSTVTELWEKLINNELRNIQNQPLSKKAKYFSKYLKINFEQSSEYPLPLENIHDMRHLIVHRLGKTDEQYRKKYKTPDSHININEDTLEQALSSIRSFGVFIFEQASTLVEENIASSESYKAIAKIKVLRDRIIYIFDLDYKFIDGESLVWCSDFIKKIDNQGSMFEIEMLGDKTSVISYLKFLKRLEGGRSIDIISISPENWRETFGIPGRKLSKEEIMELAKNMPPRPWKKDIHKRIANLLGTSNNVMSKAISEILEDPDLLVLIGQDVKYS